VPLKTLHLISNNEFNKNCGDLKLRLFEYSNIHVMSRLAQREFESGVVEFLTPNQTHSNFSINFIKKISFKNKLIFILSKENSFKFLIAS
jgi:hypothetical protein